jgi:LmbE family N-acetylglucosaminyl deacetylase
VKWIYLSPHFDDVALSCGGLVWEQARGGSQVEIWTVCAGEIPAGELSPFASQLHARWGTGSATVAQREAEDRAACAILGAGILCFDIPDAIYRKSRETGEYLYAGEEAIFGTLERGEEDTIARLAAQFLEKLSAGAQLVCPLALGDHVDHQLVREAAERTRLSLRYYADYPYVIDNEEKLDGLENAGCKRDVYPLTTGALSVWVESVAAYSSQISSFWEDKTKMEQAIVDYSRHNGGICLWSQP